MWNCSLLDMLRARSRLHLVVLSEPESQESCDPSGGGIRQGEEQPVAGSDR